MCARRIHRLNGRRKPRYIRYTGTQNERTTKQGFGLGLEVSVSRQSRELTTSRLGLVSDKVLNVSGLVSVLAQNVSASRLGLGLFHVVGRDVLCSVRAVWRSIVVVVPYRPICP